MLKIAFLSFLFYKIGVGIYANYTINNTKLKYSACIITEFRRGSKVPPSFNYFFYYNGIKYNNSYSITNDLGNKNNSILESYVGKKFILKFAEKDIEVNNLILDCPIHDSIVPPKEGWAELPCEITNRSCADWSCQE